VTAGGPRGVVLTGCSTGIGRACALTLAHAGYRVFAGVRRAQDGESLQAEAGSAALVPLLLDVTDAEAVARAADTVREELGEGGALAGLVNNAGIAVYGPLELLPIETLRRQFEINVIGHVTVTQAFLPLLRRDRGRVVMVGSSSSFLTPPFLGPYASSKCALASLTDAFRRELAPWGIQVILMQPGAVITPLWDKSIDQGDHWFDALPESARRLYARGYGAMRRLFRDKSGSGITADELALRVLQVLSAKRPGTHHPMGLDTLGYRVLDKLPARVVDAMLAVSLGHTEKGLSEDAD
jgi:NAD(P)-dependent dehydrogenase (short-subunit alcohol dehydrogenase family)